MLACEHLERQGFECRLPRTRRALRTMQGMIDKIEPLFPRYLFLRADTGCQDLSRVRSTRGVSGLVRFGVMPAHVPEEVIATLDARAEHGLIRLDAPDLREGERVRVTAGPFGGLEAIFQARSGAERVVLLVKLLGEMCRVEVPLQHLAVRL
jgi:transcriptional antiterminator RfaH